MGRKNFEYAKPYVDAALSGQTISFEYHMSRSDKPSRWMKVNYVPDTRSQGSAQGVYALITDVTASKQAESALRQSESILRSFFESGVLLMGVVELCDDDILHITDNATTAAFFGTTPEEMHNRTATALGVPRHIVDEWIRHYRAAARTGAPVKFDYEHVKEGKTQHLNATVCSIGRGPSGYPRFSYVVADVTEQRIAAERLHRNLTLLSAITNGTTDAVYLKDMEGRYLLANPAVAAAAGRPIDEIVGHTDWELFSPETAGQLTDDDHRVIALDSTQTFEEEVTTADFARTYLSTKDVYRDESGTVIGVIGVSRDITERKHVERELQTANERYRDLSRRLIEIQEEERRAIAHDLHDQLGQLLTAIKLELSSLKKKLRSQQPAPGLESLLAQVGSSLQLVDQAIDASRHAAMGLRPTHLDDLGLVAAIQWLAKDLETRSGILCELTTSPDHSTFQLGEAISTGLFRITQELLTNIARHAEASEVHISLTQTAESLVLQIEDNGAGIATEVAAKPTGLGLRGVRERSSLLNGEFSIDGAPGKGTTAVVRIPLHQERGANATVDSQASEVRP
ncbi:MAG: PAS domain-containing protein [Nitrospiraceae bacterium]